MNERRRRVANREGSKWQHATFWQNPFSGERGNVEHVGGQVPLRKPRRRFRGGGSCTVLATATEVEDGHVPPWRPDNEYASEVLFDVLNSRYALSGPGNDCQRFAHLQSIIQTEIGREELGSGMTAFWQRIVNEPDTFLPGVATGAEAIATGIRRRRSGSLRVRGRCLCRPCGDHGQHG